MDYAIKAENVWMLFNLSRQGEERIKEYVLNMVRGRLQFERFWAVKGVSLQVEKGGSLGIIGLNGAGKSTLLKIICGIIRPTVGKVETNGVIAPLIELGGGFNGNMTARENIFFTGAMHGHSRKYMSDRCEQILEFAELNDFADVPVRNFSSGMRSRLGFAIATEIEPDILVMDEVLSVGDMTFREKSMGRTKEIIEGGATVLFVSHSIDQVKRLCKEVIWLEKGHMKMYGPTAEVCKAYQAANKPPQKK